MRVAIVSRIFTPEPSAASFRLDALASVLERAGHQVTVLTVAPPSGIEPDDGRKSYRVKRFPVLRDRKGYVRGYLQYMSFDVPLFFRLLFSRKFDLVIVEPPPTTGLAVRLVAALRRVPYAYYAADIWSDASSQTGAPSWIVRGVRSIERYALRGAKLVFSVSEGVSTRLEELGISSNVTTIGNGIDVEAFGTADFDEPDGEDGPVFVYAGTASEWHGADVFIEAMPAVLREYPHARLQFIGGGSERDALKARAVALGIENAVHFEGVRAPSELGSELRNACLSIASVRPGMGYDFAFPTKLYGAAVCGTPLLYSGIGPAVDFVRTRIDEMPIGSAVGTGIDEVAAALSRAAGTPYDSERRRAIAAWARENLSLNAVAQRAVLCIESEAEDSN